MDVDLDGRMDGCVEPPKWVVLKCGEEVKCYELNDWWTFLFQNTKIKKQR